MIPQTIKFCTGCGVDVSKMKRTKDTHGNYYCQNCWAAQTARSSTSVTQTELLFCEVCNGHFTQQQLRLVVGRVVCDECVTAVQITKRNKRPEGTHELGTHGQSADELYADVAWYRRNGPISLLTVLGIFIGISLVPVCLIVLTGPVYYRKLAAPRQLKTWGPANRVIAVGLLVFWLGTIIVMSHARSVSPVVSQISPSPTPEPTVVAQVQPPTPRPLVHYVASVDDVAHNDVANTANSSASQAPRQSALQPASEPTQPPLTDAECQTWANSLEQATAAGEITFISQSIDADLLAHRAMTGITMSDVSMQRTKAIATELITGVSDLHEALIKKKPCKVLWTRAEHGERVAMVRCLLKDEDVDYLELTLGRADSRDIRVVDIFELSTGGDWSQVLRSLALPLVISADAGALPSLNPTDKDIINHSALLGEIYSKTDLSQSRLLTSLFAQLPPSLQADRYLSILNVKATAQVSDAAFNAAVHFHEERYPDDPSLSYATLQKRTHDKDFVKVLEALNTLKKVVGDDPFIVGLKASAYAGIGNVAMTKQTAQQAVSEEPSLVQPHWLLVYVALEEKNYAEVSRLLTVLEKELGETTPDLKHDADYAGFVASPQYRSWAAMKTEEAAQKARLDMYNNRDQTPIFRQKK